MRKDVDKFVAGYVGKNQCVYGVNTPNGPSEYITYFATLRGAERKRQRLARPDMATIYKLVAVKMPAKKREVP